MTKTLTAADGSHPVDVHRFRISCITPLTIALLVLCAATSVIAGAKKPSLAISVLREKAQGAATSDGYSGVSVIRFLNLDDISYDKVTIKYLILTKSLGGAEPALDCCNEESVSIKPKQATTVRTKQANLAVNVSRVRSYTPHTDYYQTPGNTRAVESTIVNSKTSVYGCQYLGTGVAVYLGGELVQTFYDNLNVVAAMKKLDVKWDTLQTPQEQERVRLEKYQAERRAAAAPKAKPADKQDGPIR